MQSEFVSPEHIAGKLGITSVTVLSLIKTGALKAFRIGRQWRIKQSDLEAFIERGSNQREGTAA